MKRAWMVVGLVTASWGLLACDETTPTSSNGGLIPLNPTTVEVVLPFEAFASQIRVYGGYGTTSELFESILAQDYEGELDSRVLVRFSRFPWAATVRDSTGTTRLDSAFTFVGGRLVLRFDTTEANRPAETVQLAAGALTEGFDARTASWTVAVDTINERRVWPEPGAGPVTPLGEALWDPTAGDTVVFELDSAMVAQLGDSVTAGPGVRIDLLTPGLRMNLLRSELRLSAIPNVHRDTVVDLTIRPTAQTFVYDPFPQPSADGIRVGGTPSWRTVLTVGVPALIEGSPSLCARVTCPIVLTAERINSASILLTTEPSQPAFQPSDTLLLDVRPVLASELLPKSPLGSSLVGGLGVRVAPESFRAEGETVVALPITSFLRTVLGQTDDDAVNDLVLLTPIEPFSLGFGSFVGPGRPGAPQLRLILTLADTVEIS